MLKDIPFLEEAKKLILNHHEQYDGKGYPDGLKCEATSLDARLIAIADAFDAMTTERSYHSALSIDYAISELYRFSGKQFCPVAVEALTTGFHNYHFPATS
jgi:HD-GYP domain-containing protein (c-di-GMP phosphodiesterase class II)